MDGWTNGWMNGCMNGLMRSCSELPACSKHFWDSRSLMSKKRRQGHHRNTNETRRHRSKHRPDQPKRCGLGCDRRSTGTLPQGRTRCLTLRNLEGPYTLLITISMELAPKRPSPLWFWGPNSIIVVCMDPLGK